MNIIEVIFTAQVQKNHKYKTLLNILPHRNFDSLSQKGARGGLIHRSKTCSIFRCHRYWHSLDVANLQSRVFL